jgi:hypothetical protein
MSFSSQLGTILPGAWQLGQVPANAVTTGSFTATAFPSCQASGVGGVQRPFTSVLGTIVPGLWQLGAVPAGSVTSGETTGKGSFLGSAFPSCVATAPPATGSFSGSAYPSCTVRGNQGPLLISFTFYPSATVEDIMYYANGSFVCSSYPGVIVQGTQTNTIIFTVFPGVVLSPLVGQPFSCITAPLLSVTGEIKNGSFQ